MISNTILFSNHGPLINKICFSVCLVANELEKKKINKKKGTQPSDGYTKQGYFTISYRFDCLYRKVYFLIGVYSSL